MKEIVILGTSSHDESMSEHEHKRKMIYVARK